MTTDRNIILSGIIAVMVLFLIPAISFSEVTFTTLEPITSGLRFPEDVAVSSDGSVYVVDGSKGKVLIYDKTGQPEGSISVASPTSVAVNNGNIYIGSNNDLSVKIYNSSHNMIGSLGSGAGEFKLPRNIAIDVATGNVYVVDQLDYSIKVYTSSGAFISKINDYPDLPQDVTIMNNKIYVIDHPLITLIVNGQAGTIRGAEVSVFDIAGNHNHIRDFGTYGSDEGQFIRPAGITSDADGILYITDSFHGVVMCFDTTQNDSYLGAIHNPSKPMGTPMGIALGGDRRLFVASLFTKSVYVFGLEGYTGGIDVSPSSLLFTAQEGQNPSNQTLTISNSGADTQSYSATRTESWIILEAPPVVVSPGSPGVISVGINISGLSAGTYYGEITITAGSGASEDIPVTLDVTAPPAPPVLSVTPQTLDYTYSIGDPAPSSKAVTIELSNVITTTTWTAMPDSAWISINPSTILANGNLSTVANVEVNPSNLEAGTHTGNITINAPGAVGSPATVEVTLTIKNGGTIEVNCNIEDASFTIESPVTYEGSGQSWTATEVPDGTHTITYNPVIGYKTPPSETQTISGGGTITFEGNYISLAMAANIVASKNVVNRNSTTTIGIFNSEGKMLFSFVPFTERDFDKYSIKSAKIYIYGVNTAAGDIDGDGKADIVVALGASSNTNPALVAAYTADGKLIPGSDFIALSTMYGANIAAADFDGDGKAEIVVGAGSNTSNPAQVRIFTYNPDSETIEDTGIDFKAFTVKGGVNIAAGDVDGDGVPELITAAGAKSGNSPGVSVWEVETSAATWSVNNTVNFIAFSGKYGANVTTGDINGDGISEIIVSSGPDPKGGFNMIKVFNGNGTEFGLMITDSSKGYGLSVASADLDNDGIAEIVAGLGPSSKNPSTVKIYKADKTVLNTFTAFEGTWYGAVVSVGDLGY
jgi:hypothetical protein